MRIDARGPRALGSHVLDSFPIQCGMCRREAQTALTARGSTAAGAVRSKAFHTLTPLQNETQPMDGSDAGAAAESSSTGAYFQVGTDYRIMFGLAVRVRVRVQIYFCLPNGKHEQTVPVCAHAVRVLCATFLDTLSLSFTPPDLSRAWDGMGMGWDATNTEGGAGYRQTGRACWTDTEKKKKREPFQVDAVPLFDLMVVPFFCARACACVCTLLHAGPGPIATSTVTAPNLGLQLFAVVQIGGLLSPVCSYPNTLNNSHPLLILLPRVRMPGSAHDDTIRATSQRNAFVAATCSRCPICAQRCVFAWCVQAFCLAALSTCCTFCGTRRRRPAFPAFGVVHMLLCISRPRAYQGPVRF